MLKSILGKISIFKLQTRLKEKAGLKHFNDSKAFIEYSNDIEEIYNNIEKYNPNNKSKILIVFDGMIASMLSNKKQSRTSTNCI